MPGTKMSSLYVIENGTDNTMDAFSTAGVGARAFDQRVEQRRVLRRVELHTAEPRLDPQQTVRVVAEMHRLNLLYAAHEQSRADEQHDGERGLNDEQGSPKSRPLARAFTRARLERGGDIRASRLKDRRETGEQPGDERSSRQQTTARGRRRARCPIQPGA